jgi:serine/threonine protein phosphatase PrpC
MVNGNKLVSANAGDSRAVLGSLKDKDYKPRREESKALCVEENDRQWVAKAITRDHKPDDPGERQRILDRGGRIDSYKGKFGENVGPMRVWLMKESYPGLAMSRSIGDACAHSVGVIAEPGKS